jgi:RNA polymerase sigma-70 factor (ECF subfamily)
MQSKAEEFTELRPALMKLAHRMLRSEVESEDIVQEAYLRWERAAPDTIRSPKAFLTTIVTRLCLNHLDRARVRLEHSDAPSMLENSSSGMRSPAEHAELADALSEAFMGVLGNLSSTERAVFLLREAFDFDYCDIASVVDRSEANCRQILRRARERIAARESSAKPAREGDQRVVSEFLKAAETGEVDRLVSLLSEEAALARDPGDLSKPSPPIIRDPQILFKTLGNTLADLRSVSDRFLFFPVGRDYACVARAGRTTRGAILLRVVEQKVAAIRLVSCPSLLRQLKILMAVHTGEDFQEGSANKSN